MQVALHWRVYLEDGACQGTAPDGVPVRLAVIRPEYGLRVADAQCGGGNRETFVIQVRHSSGALESSRHRKLPGRVDSQHDRSPLTRIVADGRSN